MKLKGIQWTEGDFCRGWLITGMTGSGKTTAAINPMLEQLTKNVPNWGGVCIDEKGLFWETLSSIFKEQGREKDLVLLKIRPDGAGKGWKPTHRFNLLSEESIPYSTYQCFTFPMLTHYLHKESGKGH